MENKTMSKTKQKRRLDYSWMRDYPYIDSYDFKLSHYGATDWDDIAFPNADYVYFSTDEYWTDKTPDVRIPYSHKLAQPIKITADVTVEVIEGVECVFLSVIKKPISWREFLIKVNEVLERCGDWHHTHFEGFGDKGHCVEIHMGS
jgi:hypothetical protein